MSRVTSKDGTSIVYDRQGTGPAVILVTGALDDGSENAPLATALAGQFTVYNYRRRGRGDSGDTLPYAVEREIADIDTLIGVAGGSACLYGVSSGGMFVLEAAAAGLAIEKLAVCEVPYDVAGDAPQRFREYAERLGAALAEGRRGDAVACSCGWQAPPRMRSRRRGAPRTLPASKRSRAHPRLRRGLLRPATH